MGSIAAIFLDIGGVCLTNGWDTDARQSAASHFSIDLDEFDERHQNVVDALERGEQSLDEYLDYAVFHRHQPFSRDEFIRFMRDRSQPYNSVLRLLRELASTHSYKLATINNESREMNRYRIDTFQLRDIFAAFFSSCYVGVRKPAARIYELALDVMQADPATTLFVDDRAENVEGARVLGIRTIHVTDRLRLSEQLRDAGVEIGLARGIHKGDGDQY